ncbi:unnamed protein product [Linum trigynum]|uniref:Uncharacterized protein n=1 Tax=Linum trigynum TaxID=586398 RepID=A0AAV2FGE5_9ROSI
MKNSMEAPIKAEPAAIFTYQSINFILSDGKESGALVNKQSTIAELQFQTESSWLSLMPSPGFLAGMVRELMERV